VAQLHLRVQVFKNSPNGPVATCNVSPSPTDVSPTENSWILYLLDKVSLGYFAPDRTIPSPNFDILIFLIIILGGLYGSDWRYVRLGQFNRDPMGRRIAAVDPAYVIHAWRGPGSGHIGQGHNIQGTLWSRGATSKNFRSGTHRSGTHQPCISWKGPFSTYTAYILKGTDRTRDVSYKGRIEQGTHRTRDASSKGSKGLRILEITCTDSTYGTTADEFANFRDWSFLVGYFKLFMLFCIIFLFLSFHEIFLCQAIKNRSCPLKNLYSFCI
jgi:hypothetical protein